MLKKECVWKTLLQKLASFVIFHRKTSKMAYSCCLEKFDSQKNTFGIRMFCESRLSKRNRFRNIFWKTRYILNPEFYNLSNIEPTVYKLVTFGWRFLQRVRLRIKLFSTRQILNRTFIRHHIFRYSNFVASCIKKTIFVPTIHRKNVKNGIYVLS